MKPELVAEDRKIAQAICDDIGNGDTTSLNRWFLEHYQAMYKKIVSSKRSNKKEILRDPEDILHKFYIELGSGNAFCQYQGLRGCSLRSYILGRLKMRSQVEKNSKLPPLIANLSDLLPKVDDGFEIEDSKVFEDSKASAEELLIDAQRRRLLFQAIDQLSDDLETAEDAMLISRFLREETYEEIAKRLLVSKNIALTDDVVLRESARLRKRETRRPGGSIEKLGAILKQLMGEKGLSSK